MISTAGSRDRDHLEVAPADFRNLLAHPDDALGPVQHRVRIAPLFGGVDVLVAVGALVDHGRARPVALGEAGMRLGRPLHRRAGAVALGQIEIVAHRDLVAVADDRRPRQRAHQAVGQFEPPPVAAQHRRQPAADAAVVELHALVGTERLEHGLALRLGQPAEIEFVVVAQEQAPLRGGRPRLGRRQRFRQRPRIGGSQRIEQMLVDVEIEHHVHAVAVAAEILHVGFGQHVGFGEDDGVALSPLQEFAERAQHVVLLDRLAHLGALGRDHERHRVHAEAGDAELNPEPHDLEDFRLHMRVRRVEIGLEIVEAMEVPGAGFLVARPGRFLHAGKHHAGIGIGRLLVGPDVPVAIGRILRASRLSKPGVLVGGVIDDEIDDHADAALLAAMGEFDEVAERAVARIDAVIVRDIVAVVLAGRRLERHQPDRGDAEPVQIVQPPQQAPEIADAVAVGVHIGADGKAIDHAVLVPEVVDHRATLIGPPRDLSGRMINGKGHSGFRQNYRLFVPLAIAAQGDVRMTNSAKNSVARRRLESGSSNGRASERRLRGFTFVGRTASLALGCALVHTLLTKSSRLPFRRPRGR